MKCDRCNGEMLMIVKGEFSLGSGHITTLYICNKCKKIIYPYIEGVDDFSCFQDAQKAMSKHFMSDKK